MKMPGDQIGRPAGLPIASAGAQPVNVAITRCADAAVISALHRATVIVAYRDYFPDRPPPTVAELQAGWASRLADPTAVALLATRDGRPVGSVLARSDPEFGEGQIVGLHVLPSEWGQGIGSGMHDAALALLLEAGHRTAGLWVIAENRRARGMYESRGWELLLGVEQVDNGVGEVRYRRDMSVPIQQRSTQRRHLTGSRIEVVGGRSS